MSHQFFKKFEDLEDILSHYSHKSMADAKFESGSFSSFGDMTSQKFPSEEGNQSSNSSIYPRKMGLTFKKSVFMSRIVLLNPKLTPPMSISAIFKQRKILSFSKFLRRLDEERVAATLLIDQFCCLDQIWSEHVSKIKTKSHKVWAS